MNRLIPTLMALAAAWPAAAGETVNQQVEAAADGEVVIEIVRGMVSVEGWDQNSVSVVGTRDDESDEFSVEREGNVITIEDDVHSMRFSRGKGTDIAVKVPRRNSVKLSVISADIELRDLSGDVRAESVSGNIGATNAGGDARMESVSGNIKVFTAARRVDAESVSGDIEIDNSAALSRADLSTVSGNLTLRSALDPEADVELESVSGDVTLNFRGEVNARISAETGPGGEIENGLSAAKPDEERYTGAESLEMKVGNGGADVDASVISGTIRFTKE
ncbi:MAG: DUF4097 family beta strand repeat protein [Gammaproteobacteria bacterium]|nr:DUF4097 family beta strand repeat protein [Gammaproteobacteria bacterium]